MNVSVPDPAAGAPADLEVIVLEGNDRLREVESLLEAAEEAAGLPLVDESEHERLRALAQGARRAATWRSALLRRGDQPVAYSAVITGQHSDEAAGDVAVQRPIRDAEQVTAAALIAARHLAIGAGAHQLQVWLRAVGPAELAAAAAAGFRLERRLRILGCGLPNDDPQGAAALQRLADAGTVVRSYLPDDDAEVVGVLAGAYEGTDDGGWDLARFGERRGWSWFQPEDLLVAADPDGSLAGLHWLKRRGPETGEVYNLAVHPRAQGRGVGPALLYAGLQHLAAIGCREVILWVDASNERAVRLYEGHGFATRWEDVALGSATELAGS